MGQRSPAWSCPAVIHNVRTLSCTVATCACAPQARAAAGPRRQARNPALAHGEATVSRQRALAPTLRASDSRGASAQGPARTREACGAPRRRRRARRAVRWQWHASRRVRCMAACAASLPSRSADWRADVYRACAENRLSAGPPTVNVYFCLSRALVCTCVVLPSAERL